MELDICQNLYSEENSYSKSVIPHYASLNICQNPIRGHVQMNSWPANESAAVKI